MTMYRMHRAKRLPGDYRGAIVAGGRWNPIGTPMLYTAEHLSLACLEVLVHLDKGQLPRDYAWSRAELPYTPEVLTTSIPSSISACQAAGEAWIQERTKLASRVPSVIITRRVQRPAESVSRRIRDRDLERAPPFSLRSETLRGGTQTL